MPDFTFERKFQLEGIEILRSARDGRTVEAYAAVFDAPSEISDQHGHYMEAIGRSAFDKAIAGGIDRVGVYYHHGMTLHGTPSDLGAVPIGSPVEIRADERGLRTVTRYNKSQLADSVLEAIRNGDIRGYSFRGRIVRSDPRRIPKARPGRPLPTVTRLELGLTEYGPTPVPAYADAAILAVRSQAARQLIDGGIDPEEAVEIARRLTLTPPGRDQEASTAPPETGPGAEDQRIAPSGRLQRFARFRAESQFLGAVKK